MIKNFFVLIATVLFLFISCGKDETPKSDLIIKDNLIYKKGSNTPFTGREKARVEDKIIEYDIADGIKHGDFRLYYEDGTLQIKGQIDKNKNIGKWQYFYETGELESEGYFVDDLPEGRWAWFYVNGKLREEGSYHKGNRVGWWRQFDESGKLFFEKEFTPGDSSTVDEDTLASKINQFPF